MSDRLARNADVPAYLLEISGKPFHSSKIVQTVQVDEVVLRKKMVIVVHILGFMQIADEIIEILQFFMGGGIEPTKGLVIFFDFVMPPRNHSFPRVADKGEFEVLPIAVCGIIDTVGMLKFQRDVLG